MAEEGLDVRTWLTILGVLVGFFVLPALTLEYDRRKKLRRPHRHEDSEPPPMPEERPSQVRLR